MTPEANWMELLYLSLIFAIRVTKINYYHLVENIIISNHLQNIYLRIFRLHGAKSIF